MSINWIKNKWNKRGHPIKLSTFNYTQSIQSSFGTIHTLMLGTVCVFDVVCILAIFEMCTHLNGKSSLIKMHGMTGRQTYRQTGRQIDRQTERTRAIGAIEVLVHHGVATLLEFVSYSKITRIRESPEHIRHSQNDDCNNKCVIIPLVVVCSPIDIDSEWETEGVANDECVMVVHFHQVFRTN